MESQLYYPTGGTAEVGEEHVTCALPCPGLHRKRAVVFSTGFPFGFTGRKVRSAPQQILACILFWSSRGPSSTICSPNCGEVESHFRGRGHDFHPIRPYVAFESSLKTSVRTPATSRSGSSRRKKNRRCFSSLGSRMRCTWSGSFADRSSILVWHFSQHGGNVTLHQDAPDEGDVYAILKYRDRRRSRKSNPTLHEAPAVFRWFSAPSRSSKGGPDRR